MASSVIRLEGGPPGAVPVAGEPRWRYLGPPSQGRRPPPDPVEFPVSDPRQTPIPALIVYSSRTGRTEKAAQAVKTHLEWRNYTVDLHKVGSGSVPDVSPYRLLVFGYAEKGIPGLHPLPDSNLTSFIQKLPALDGKKAAVFSVQLIPNIARTSHEAVGKQLIEKGADVVIDRPFKAARPEEDAPDLACECMIRVYR